MILPQSRLSRMTLAALATLLGQAGLAHADVVVGASSAAAVATATGTPSSYTDTGYINSSTWASDATGYASGYAFANVGGAYAVNSFAEGIGSASAHAQFANRFYNTSGVAQHYTLSFRIYGGSISAYDYGYRPLDSGEFLTASYAASVKVSLNGGTQNTAFSSSATLTRNAAGFSLVRNGTVLNGADDPATQIDDGNYAWSNAYYSVDLGVVAAGSYIDVLAEVDNGAGANVGVYNFSGSECGYGDGYGNGDGCYGSNYLGYAGSFYGDPLELSGDPLNLALTSTAVAQDLPEPASLALVGLAVGAAGVARRRRRQGDGE